MKWSHSAHRLAKSYPSYFNKKEEKKLKMDVRGLGRTYLEDFYQQGEETWGSSNSKFPGDLSSFWKSEDKGDWAGIPVNKRWKRDVSMCTLQPT